MKKKLAALLCGVMCLTGFSGCSDAELAYLKMSGDLLDTMASCEVSGKVQADVDFDGLRGFLADAAEAANSGPDLSALEGLSGKKAATLDYKMQMDLNQLEYMMDFDLTYEKEKYDMGTLYYSLTDGVFYSTDGLLGLYDLAGDLVDEELQAGYFFSDAYAADLKAALAQEKYITLLSAEDLTGLNMDETMPEKGLGEIYDAAVTFYQDVLKGFETGTVKQSNGGFVIEADGQKAAALFIDLLDFLAANPNQVLDATEAYLITVTEQMGMSAEERAEVSALFTEARANKEAFVDTVIGIKEFVQIVLEEESVQMLLDGVQYQATVKQSGSSFTSDETTTMTHKGKVVCKIASDATVKKATVALRFPASGMSADALAEKLDTLNNKYNPVTGVNICWGWEDTATEALISVVREEAAPFDMEDGAEWTDLIMKDGRAYMPLRKICDMLGEDIGWDKATKTAFVTVDGKKIELDGILQNGSSFVGVREFEKLGYTVDYSSANGEKAAVIYR